MIFGFTATARLWLDHAAQQPVSDAVRRASAALSTGMPGVAVIA
jgi:hypothetical protein